jgi:DNA-binding CsgD family transcriptional regulator
VPVAQIWSTKVGAGVVTGAHAPPSAGGAPHIAPPLELPEELPLEPLDPLDPLDPLELPELLDPLDPPEELLPELPPLEPPEPPEDEAAPSPPAPASSAGAPGEPELGLQLHAASERVKPRVSEQRCARGRGCMQSALWWSLRRCGNGHLFDLRAIRQRVRSARTIEYVAGLTRAPGPTLVATMPRSHRSPPSSRRGVAPAPPGLRASAFRFHDQELAVLSFPAPALELPSSLSAAEREIVLALAEGLSNAAIARQRGTSTRTVANQVSSLFRKMNVRSRTELLLALAQPTLR